MNKMNLLEISRNLKQQVKSVSGGLADAQKQLQHKIASAKEIEGKVAKIAREKKLQEQQALEAQLEKEQMTKQQAAVQESQKPAQEEPEQITVKTPAIEEKKATEADSQAEKQLSGKKLNENEDKPVEQQMTNQKSVKEEQQEKTNNGAEKKPEVVVKAEPNVVKTENSSSQTGSAGEGKVETSKAPTPQDAVAKNARLASPRRENQNPRPANNVQDNRGRQNREGGYQGRNQEGGYQNRGERPQGNRGGGLKMPRDIAPVEVKEKINYESKSKAKKKNFEDTRKPRKGAIKETGAVQIEEEYRRGRRKPKKEQRPAAVVEPIKIEKATIVGDSISVKLFAEKTGKPVSEIIKKLLLLGMMCTINSQIDFDTASLVASDFGIELEQKIEKTAEDLLSEENEEADDPSEMVERPPVVTIMGHVDHGKTSLLDAIRESKVAEKEAGGITQHIGAYQITVRGKRKITFLDTPGHEAFTAMRARGAQATDIAVLVVAADDGVMPQTVEAINHAKSAGVPIIVAINKIDKEGASVDKIKQELTEYSLVAEEWGGDTIMVPVSAKTKEGLDDLLDTILLVAEMAELKANPNRHAKGIVIEAKLDKGRGPVATVLVQNGTLHVQDTIVAGTASGRVRAMLNERGKALRKAVPSQPVEVVGFSEVPEAGDIMYAVEQDKLSRQVVEERKERQKAEMLKKISKVSLDDLFNQIAEGEIKTLNLVIKADVQGSVEAVRESLEKISNEEVKVKAIHCGVGAIKESDVMLASAANAIIIGFNVRPENQAATLAEKEHVDIRLYRVIYHAIEDIEKAMTGMLAPEFEEEIIGHAEVRQTFKVSSVGTIAGCYVQDGKMMRNASVRLLRDNIVVHEGKLSSLKRFKDDAKEVASGFECGMTIEGYNDIKEGDIIEAFVMREIER